MPAITLPPHVRARPRDVLMGSPLAARVLPVCDHYCGSESLILKSLRLQSQLHDEFGRCVFDVTMDCDDGAPVGAEEEHARKLVELAAHAAPGNRLAVRVHPVSHAYFDSDVAIIAGALSQRLSHIMLPKVETVADVLRADHALSAAGAGHLPLHVLVESALAVRNVFEIAAHPRVESISFGLMDFVSSHGGAIPASAMSSVGQFSHPLVLRAKLEIAAACHAFGKVASHCVVTEYKDKAALCVAADRAALELGYTRMWSIHPDQIRPILRAFSPLESELGIATEIIAIASRNDWAPISFNGVLHDRASYRFYWQVLERAQLTGRTLAPEIQALF